MKKYLFIVLLIGVCFGQTDSNDSIEMKDGKIHTVNKGDIFYVSSKPHDSWVVGRENYVSIHFLGADKYADK